MSVKRSFLKRVTAILVVVAISFAAEFAFVAAGRANDSTGYQKTIFTASFFDSWEFSPLGDDKYFALANNSYFYKDNIGGRPAQNIDVYFSRSMSDKTETVIYFSGVKDGIEGEFVAPLVQKVDGVYTAALDVSSLDSIRIYPTESVRTEITFSGAMLNPSVASEKFSPGRLITIAMSIFALVSAAVLVAGKLKKKVYISVWGALYTILCAAVVLVVFQATRMFSAVNGKQDMLVPLAFGIFSLFYLFLWLIIKRFVKLETKLAAIVFIVGTIFALASAPLQAPDEHTHFLRAFSISEGRLSFYYSETFPDDVELLCEVFPGEFYNVVQDAGVSSVSARISEYFSRVSSEMSPAKVHTSIQLVFPYLPSALGIAAARIFSANALICMYVARIFNVALFALCAFYALKWAKRYRGMIVLISLLPLSLFMVASTSYDSMMLSAVVLFFGIIFKGETRFRDLILLALTFGIIVSIKPLYVPLAFAVFAMPSETTGGGKRRAGVFAFILSTGVLFYAGSLLYASLFARGISPSSIPDGVNLNAQILYVIKNPLRYLIVMFVDGYMRGFYLDTFGLLGWLDVMCVLTNLLTPVIMIVVAGMYSDDSKLQKRSDPWIFAGIALATYGIVVTGFYATWSTLGSTSITGVQPRYFLPIVPLMCAILSRLMSGIMRGTRNEHMRDTACIYICGLFAVVSAAELGVQYFLT